MNIPHQSAEGFICYHFLNFPFLFDKKTGVCIALTKKEALELVKELKEEGKL